MAEKTHAIVIGASIAGLAAARALADRVDRVTVLERDALADDEIVRPNVPQAHHTHVLLAAGHRALEAAFPGLTAELEAQGAMGSRASRTFWFQDGAPFTIPDEAVPGVAASRPLLESTLRRRLLADHPNVTLLDRTAATALTLEDGRVTGVRTRDAQHRADLVVACTGRGTRLLDSLREHGFPTAEESTVRIDVAYATQEFRRDSADMDTTTAVVLDDPAGSHRAGALLAIAPDRWIVTLSAQHGDPAPTDAQEFLDFAHALPSPVIAQVLDRSEPLGPVHSYRLPTGRRRHVERLASVPAGFVALGDAICSFNPLYGQGMSSAALQAVALGEAIDAHGVAAPGLPHEVYTRASAVLDAPWAMAVTADFADPRAAGDKPRGTDVFNRYLTLVVRACHTSPQVALQFFAVQNLLAPPQSLMALRTMARVLRAAPRSPAGRARRAEASTREAEHSHEPMRH
ncbi:NAD(P)/FAD-dependent oxidoreductase [uncultured Demequina sp.]|uniref:NAD(P)/FAD-dependent oxidoreductase n=1 Tax=uncultured Demequina sp. TaxID=693499 RepID=UPI0025ECB314|nr:tryptophan 7-halogenase [uncultured Demequina sp.]